MRFALVIAFALMVAGCWPGHKDPSVHVHADTQAAQQAMIASAARIDGFFYKADPTGSMEPLIHGGDYLVIAYTPFAELQVGQVVVLKYNEARVVHRIEAQIGDGWITSGDSNPRIDREVMTRDHYIGTVVEIHKGGA